MPKKNENNTQPQEAPTSATQSQRSRKIDDQAANGEPPEATPAAENGKAAAPSFSGLRGEDYIKAIAGQPLTSLEVPLLPNERRGDWERAKGVKIRVTTRQLTPQSGTAASPWLERAHPLAALVIELQRPGAARFDQIDLTNTTTREAIERLSDYVNQARLRAQAQTGKKWTASQVYLIPVEDA